MTITISDIGINHNGNESEAVRLIDIAKDIGIDYVKFQCFWCFPQLRQYEFTKMQFANLFSYCDKVGQKWFATPFDYDAVDFLKSWGMTTWKLPSNLTVLHDFTLLKAIERADRQTTILSTGRSTDDEIDHLLAIFGQDTVLLHCVSEYPTPLYRVNLQRIKELKDKFSVRVGYSDHSGQCIPLIRAVTNWGAEIVEAHITMNHEATGPDHRASLTPEQWRTVVKEIKCA